MNVYTDVNKISEKPAEEGQLYIYVLENYPQKNIKIGRTTNPLQRMRSLSGSNNGGNKISRVAISPVTYLYTLERTCHIKFDKYRVKGTEYFSGISFEDAVSYIEELFNSRSYIVCNELRKNHYKKGN